MTSAATDPRFADPGWRRAEARRALVRLTAFYRANSCEAVPLHALASSAVVLGDFWAVSEAFARIGASMVPVDGDGAPRTALWASYAEACAQGLPAEIRTERWLDAHVADLAKVREAGLDEAFERDAASRAHDPTWRRLRDHMRMSLGARHDDGKALSGHWAEESAFATGVVRALRRLVVEGGPLVRKYAWAAIRGLVWPGTAEGISDRRVVRVLLTSFVGAVTCTPLVRRGLRLRSRGRVSGGERWPMLEATLGPRAAEVHPSLVRFYGNPGAWDATARLSVDSVLSRVGLELVRLATGQGLTETQAEPWPARFLTYVRDDGTMHFVRELWCDGALRVFDSDFVPGTDPDGRPAVCELFHDLGVTVPLIPIVREGGALRMQAERLVFRGVRVPQVVRICFDGTPVGDDGLVFEGRAELRRDRWLGRLALGLGAPEVLGVLRYEATPARHADGADAVAS